jgi:hypothetical protein
MIFVSWLGIHAGLDGSERVVSGDRVVTVAISRVARLVHIEIQPGFVVEILRGRLLAHRVKGLQVPPFITLRQPRRHRPDDLAVILGFDWTIPAQNPEEWPISIAPSKPHSIGERIFRREYLRSAAPFRIPLVAPRRQHPYIQAKFRRPVHDIVDMPEIGFIRLSRIIVS